MALTAIAIQKTPIPDNHTRQQLLTRAILFLVLECAFIALAVSCLAASVPSPWPEAQSRLFFTAAFIMWHIVAAMGAKGCFLHDFSGEWYNRFYTTKSLIPGHTDIVSTITTGLFNQVRYFFAKDASASYRIAFLAWWGLVSLQSIAPGVIHVGSVPALIPTAVNITNFHAPRGGNPWTNLGSLINRGWIAGEIELREESSFGFTTQARSIVGWPDIQSSEQGDLEYETDVLEYDMECWWEAPTFNMTVWNTTWYAGGFAWYTYDPTLSNSVPCGGIKSMYRFPTDQKFIPNTVPDILPASAGTQTGLSGYLFIGSNSSFKSPSNKRRLNLDHLPTLYSPSGFHMIDMAGDKGFFEPPLATFLLCDPRARILDGRVLFSQKNGSVSILSTSQPETSGSSSSTQIGNITPDAANIILALGLLAVFGSDGFSSDVALGLLSAQAFLNDSTINFDSTPSTPFDVGILPIESIQSNLNTYLNSSAKGFSSYFQEPDAEVSSQPFTRTVQGLIKGARLELVASGPLLGITIALVSGISLALIINHFVLRSWCLPVFKLKTLAQYCQIGDKPHSSNGDNYLTSDNGPSRRLPYLACRLAGFVILEVAYIVLIFISPASHPVIIHLPLSSTEVTGGFTILFTAWQVLAIYFASEAITLAFSIEWSLKRSAKDRVSRLTSSGGDKARYFLTRGSTMTFRIAFVTSLMLAALNLLAPGAISVLDHIQSEGISLEVADLQSLGSSIADGNTNNLLIHLTRSDIMIALEQFQGSIYKYSVEPLWLLAWPNYKSTQDETGDIVYSTDVVRFNFSCSWRVPHTKAHEDDTVWLVDGQEWMTWDTPLTDISYTGGIIALFRDLDNQPDAQSAYLFIGANSSFPVTTAGKDRPPPINLDNLPSTSLHPAGIAINSTSDTSHWAAPLSTILLCDPQMEISGGQARLTSSTKRLNIVSSGLAPIGNIPVEAATTIFAESMMFTMGPNNWTTSQWMGPTSSLVFLTNTSMQWDAFPRGVFVQDLDTINKNMNNVVLSATKASMDGLYVDGSDQSNVSHQVMTVTGSSQVQRLALVGNRAVGFVVLGLCVAVFLGYGALIGLMEVHPGYSFDLKHILDSAPSHATSSSSLPPF